jgi:hypothetical protein
MTEKKKKKEEEEGRKKKGLHGSLKQLRCNETQPR